MKSVVSYNFSPKKKKTSAIRLACLSAKPSFANKKRKQKPLQNSQRDFYGGPPKDESKRELES